MKLKCPACFRQCSECLNDFFEEKTSEVEGSQLWLMLEVSWLARCDMGCLTAFFDKKNTDVPESKRCHPWHGSDCVLSVWKDLRAGNLWNKITDPFKSFSKFTGHSDNLYKQVRRQWDEMGGMRKPVEAQEGGKWLKRAKLKCLEAPKSCIKFTRHSKSL